MIWVELQLKQLYLIFHPADLVHREVHQKFSSCDKNVDHLNAHGLNLEHERLTCRSKVRALAAQVAQNPWLTGIVDVEGSKSNTLKTKFFALEPISHRSVQKLDRSKEEVAH